MQINDSQKIELGDNWIHTHFNIYGTWVFGICLQTPSTVDLMQQIHVT